MYIERDVKIYLCNKIVVTIILVLKRIEHTSCFEPDLWPMLSSTWMSQMSSNTQLPSSPGYMKFCMNLAHELIHINAVEQFERLGPFS